MPGDHPEDSIGDCISSVLEDNPELDEESAARICNAELKAGLDAEQKAALIDVEKAVAGIDDRDRARAIGTSLAQKLGIDPVGQKQGEENHVPEYDRAEASGDPWDGLDLEDFPDEMPWMENGNPHLDVIGEAFIQSNTGFPPADFADLAYPVAEPVDSELVLRENALQDAHSRAETENDDEVVSIVEDLAVEEFPDRAREWLPEAVVEERIGQSTVGMKAVAAGQHAPVRPAPVEPARTNQADLGHLDAENPPEEFADAIEADEFILFGVASIEKLDRGGEKSDTREVLDLSAETVETALTRFFDSEKAPGIISIDHDDIPVGRPLREYTLDEAAEIEVGGDIYQFDAGETLTTHVEDGDGDGRPELWMLADLANETPLHRKTRLAALLGDLDGFSVTFGRNETDREGHGRRVTQWDLYSVTLAPSDMVAVEGAEFDLAAFKARFGGTPDPAEQAVAEAAHELREVVTDILD